MYGGAEQLLENLVGALRAAGHRADLVRLPAAWERERVFDAAMAWRMVPIDADLVIATNFPSYFVRHPRKVVWLFHQHRVAYDLAGSELSDFDLDDGALEEQRLLVEWDTRALEEAIERFTLSAYGVRPARPVQRAHVDAAPPSPAAVRPAAPRTIRRRAVHRAAPRAQQAPRAAARRDGAGAVGRHAANRRHRQLARRARGSHRSTRSARPGRAARLGRATTSSSRGMRRRGPSCTRPTTRTTATSPCKRSPPAKPVITTSDAGGVLEWVTDGETGLVTTPDRGRVGERPSTASCRTTCSRSGWAGPAASVSPRSPGNRSSTRCSAAQRWCDELPDARPRLRCAAGRRCRPAAARPDGSLSRRRVAPRPARRRGLRHISRAPRALDAAPRGRRPNGAVARPRAIRRPSRARTRRSRSAPTTPPTSECRRLASTCATSGRSPRSSGSGGGAGSGSTYPSRCPRTSPGGSAARSSRCAPRSRRPARPRSRRSRSRPPRHRRRDRRRGSAAPPASTCWVCDDARGRRGARRRARARPPSRGRGRSRGTAARRAATRSRAAGGGAGRPRSDGRRAVISSARISPICRRHPRRDRSRERRHASGS